MKQPNKEDYHQSKTGENLFNGPYNMTRYANDLEKYIKYRNEKLKKLKSIINQINIKHE